MKSHLPTNFTPTNPDQLSTTRTHRIKPVIPNSIVIVSVNKGFLKFPNSRSAQTPQFFCKKGYTKVQSIILRDLFQLEHQLHQYQHKVLRMLIKRTKYFPSFCIEGQNKNSKKLINLGSYVSRIRSFSSLQMNDVRNRKFRMMKRLKNCSLQMSHSPGKPGLRPSSKQILQTFCGLIRPAKLARLDLSFSAQKPHHLEEVSVIESLQRNTKTLCLRCSYSLGFGLNVDWEYNYKHKSDKTLYIQSYLRFANRIGSFRWKFSQQKVYAEHLDGIEDIGLGPMQAPLALKCHELLAIVQNIATRSQNNTRFPELVELIPLEVQDSIEFIYDYEDMEDLDIEGIFHVERIRPSLKDSIIYLNDLTVSIGDVTRFSQIWQYYHKAKLLDALTLVEFNLSSQSYQVAGKGFATGAPTDRVQNNFEIWKQYLQSFGDLGDTITTSMSLKQEQRCVLNAMNLANLLEITKNMKSSPEIQGGDISDRAIQELAFMAVESLLYVINNNSRAANETFSYNSKARRFMKAFITRIESKIYLVNNKQLSCEGYGHLAALMMRLAFFGFSLLEFDSHSSEEINKKLTAFIDDFQTNKAVYLRALLGSRYTREQSEFLKKYSLEDALRPLNKITEDIRQQGYSSYNGKARSELLARFGSNQCIALLSLIPTSHQLTELTIFLPYGHGDRSLLIPSMLLRTPNLANQLDLRSLSFKVNIQEDYQQFLDDLEELFHKLTNLESLSLFVNISGSPEIINEPVESPLTDPEVFLSAIHESKHLRNIRIITRIVTIISTQLLKLNKLDLEFNPIFKDLYQASLKLVTHHERVPENLAQREDLDVLVSEDESDLIQMLQSQENSYASDRIHSILSYLKNDYHYKPSFQEALNAYKTKKVGVEQIPDENMKTQEKFEQYFALRKKYFFNLYISSYYLLQGLKKVFELQALRALSLGLQVLDDPMKVKSMVLICSEMNNRGIERLNLKMKLGKGDQVDVVYLKEEIDKIVRPLVIRLNSKATLYKKGDEKEGKIGLSLIELRRALLEK